MVKLAAGQHTPPTLPRREQGDPARRESRRTLEISGRIYEKVSHPRWNSVLVGPHVAVVVSEEPHLSGRAGPTAVDGQSVVSGGDHVRDAGKTKEKDVSTDFFPAVSDSCVAGVAAKVEEADQPVDAGSLNLCSDGPVLSQNTVTDRLTSAVVSKTGGGDTEGEMVGLRTPLVCPLASVGFMGYELVGSINRHAVVAYVDSGSTANYISEAVAQKIGLSPDGKWVKLQMADTTTRETLGRVFGVKFRCGQFMSTFDADIFPGLAHDILLGLPWLIKKNPYIDFRSGRIHVIQG